MYEHFSTPDHSIYVFPASTDPSLWFSRNEGLDAFLVVLDESYMPQEVERLLVDLVVCDTDWVETFGPGSEHLHDLVDRASVLVGRQSAVGDGSPMTAWHEDLVDCADIVAYVIQGGHGHCDVKLVLIVGSEEQVKDFIAEVRRQLVL
jgi:hypothetical protein